VGGACGKHGRGEKTVDYKVLVRKPEREHLEDQGVDGRMGSE
jgi:hypothetical protein